MYTYILRDFPTHRRPQNLVRSENLVFSFFFLFDFFFFVKIAPSREMNARFIHKWQHKSLCIILTSNRNNHEWMRSIRLQREHFLLLIKLSGTSAFVIVLVMWFLFSIKISKWILHRCGFFSRQILLNILVKFSQHASFKNEKISYNIRKGARESALLARLDGWPIFLPQAWKINISFRESQISVSWVRILWMKDFWIWRLFVLLSSHKPLFRLDVCEKVLISNTVYREYSNWKSWKKRNYHFCARCVENFANIDKVSIKKRWKDNENSIILFSSFCVWFFSIFIYVFVIILNRGKFFCRLIDFFFIECVHTVLDFCLFWKIFFLQILKFDLNLNFEIVTFS